MSQKQKMQFWLNDRWEYLDADNADNLDALDSLDFANKSDGIRALHSNSFMLGNNDWSDLIITEKQSCQYRNSHRGMMITGKSKCVNINTRIPIDPNMTYEISVRVKRLEGTGSFYCGVDTLDTNFSRIATDRANTYNYCTAEAVNPTTGTSVTYAGTISGYNEPEQNSPNKFDPYGSYFNIVLITDYNGANENGVVIIEALKIKEYMPVADTSRNGLMSATDKTKLNSLSNYTHPNDANIRHVTDAEKSTWNSKANGTHTHEISNINGLRTELDSIKASAAGAKDKVPSSNWKINPINVSIAACHDFKVCLGHIKLNYLDAIRVNMPTQTIMMHTAETSSGSRTAYLRRYIYLVPMTQVGKPVVGDTTFSLSVDNNCYNLYSKNYTIDTVGPSAQYTLDGEMIDAIPLTKDKLNPGHYAIYASYSVGNASGTMYTAFSSQTASASCYIGYDE